MATSYPRTYSRYTLHALALMGALLRSARIEKKMSTQSLAERAGISRDLLYRIEQGDARCSIGVVFELAAILGVSLFEPELTGLQKRVRQIEDRLSLLPKAVHPAKEEARDDF